jgi:hypothetical protein
MANDRDILTEVDRAIIQKFRFPSTSHTVATRVVITTTLNGKVIESKDMSEPREFPITNEFRKGRAFLRIKLHVEGKAVRKAELQASPDCEDAAIAWAQMVKARLPEIVIEFDPS